MELRDKINEAVARVVSELDTSGAAQKDACERSTKAWDAFTAAVETLTKQLRTGCFREDTAAPKVRMFRHADINAPGWRNIKHIEFAGSGVGTLVFKDGTSRQWRDTLAFAERAAKDGSWVEVTPPQPGEPGTEALARLQRKIAAQKADIARKVERIADMDALKDRLRAEASRLQSEVSRLQSAEFYQQTTATYKLTNDALAKRCDQLASDLQMMAARNRLQVESIWRLNRELQQARTGR